MKKWLYLSCYAFANIWIVILAIFVMLYELIQERISNFKLNMQIGVIIYEMATY